MGPWLSRKRAQGKGKAIKMPHTLLPQRKQIKMNAAGLPPEEAKVPKARGAVWSFLFVIFNGEESKRSFVTLL